ncbi:hypothetical protein EELLY_v1c00030 [Entomoplasma ellychniae]|uniref:BspA family leucine-rich repeat surface protein n=1 Tax=Entomoplasma ellychniae TaxID=2114 RepID=A0A8E2QXZ6_9MOLU|nr:hypothetical protein EELLY_v1c00030 [Entomoplasma ellychniae]
MKDQNGEEYTAWDTSNVTNIGAMFQCASSFNQDISKWDTSNVTNMSGMFWHNYDDLENVKEMSFDQDLTNWNVSQVTKYTKFWNNKNIKWDKQPIFTK